MQSAPNVENMTESIEEFVELEKLTLSTMAQLTDMEDSRDIMNKIVDSSTSKEEVDMLLDSVMDNLSLSKFSDGDNITEVNSEVDVVVKEDRVIAPRVILVITTDNEGNNTNLFEGESSLTKNELKANYGDNIFVYYQQLYTTVTGNQTYDEAVADETNFKKLCYTKEEFVEAFTTSFSDVKYKYITYSHKDLKKQQRVKMTAEAKMSVVKSNKVLNSKVSTIHPNFSLFLFTSLNDLGSNGTFPIKDLSDIQINTANNVLKDEDYFINEYVLKEGEDSSIKQQQESILFIVGTPAANDSYIKMINLRWITHSEGGEPVKGLIKNNLNTQTGIQVYLLRLNVQDKRQTDVFIHCNYNPNK